MQWFEGLYGIPIVASVEDVFHILIIAPKLHDFDDCNSKGLYSIFHSNVVPSKCMF